MLRLAGLTFAFVVLVAASSAWADCPAPAKDAAPTRVLLERLGSGPGDSEVAVDRPRLTIPWLLRACADKVSVQLPDVAMRGPNGEVHRLEFVDEDGKVLRGETIALTRDKPLLLLLRSTASSLLASGSHVGLVRVQDTAATAPQSLAVPMRLKHTLSSVPATIASVPVTSHDAKVFHTSQVVSVSLLVRDQDPGGADPSLRVESLARRDSDTSLLAEPLMPPTVPATAASAADGSIVYTVAFDHMKEPGRYDAVVRLAQDGYVDQNAKVTFYLKDPAWVAFLFILLGVVVSYVMSLYGAVWRPRLVSGQRIGTVIDALRAAEVAAQGDNESLAVARQVLTNLEAAWNDARSRRAAIDEATVGLYADIAQALRILPTVRKLLKDLRPESVGQALLGDLRSAELAMIAAKPDSGAVRGAIATLVGMQDASRKKVAEALKTAIDELDKFLHGARAPTLVAARAQVARARADLAALRLDDALAAYDAAVGQYADHYGALLEAQVDKARAAPMGVDAADWGAICDATRRELAASAATKGGEVRLRTLQAAARVYLSSCVASLRGFLQSKSQAVRDPVEAELVKLDEALVGGDIATATDKFDAAVGVLTAGAGGGTVMGGASALGTAFDAVAVFDLPSDWPKIARPGAATSAQKSIRHFDLLISAIVLVVAGVAGVEAVWAKDLTWGGAGAYLSAFMFGLAVDQFTKTGVAALRMVKP